MIDRRLSLTDWLKLPGNLEKYREWVQNPITQDIIELVERGIKPLPIPQVTSGADIPNLATVHYAQAVGANQVVQRLLMADAVIVAESGDTMSEQERQSLVQQGYSDSEIAEYLTGEDES